MAKWLVELAGKRSELRELARCPAPSWCVEEHSDKFYLVSSKLDEMHSAREVRDLAIELVRTLSGAARLFLDIGGVEVKGISLRDKEDAPLHQFILPDPVFIRPESHAQLRKDLSAALSAADTDATVTKAFALLDPLEREWHGLYRAFEVIKDDVGGHVTGEGWPSKTKLSCFKQTANYYRHAKQECKLPKEPMSLYDARRFVERLIRTWLKSKRKSQTR